MCQQGYLTFAARVRYPKLAEEYLVEYKELLNYFISQIYDRLTEEDKKQLSHIYEPTVVTTPDANAWKNLTVMRDGRIRIYGDYCRKSIFDDGGIRCYKESCDGGLSWKRHIVENPDMLGMSAYIPFLDKYMAVCCGEELSACSGSKKTGIYCS